MSRSVGQLMTYGPIVVRDSAPLRDAARLLDEHHVHGLPVVDDEGRLVGVVSATDMVRARTTEALWSNWPGLRVRHLMTTPALTISADADIGEAAQVMERRRVHRLVVVGTDQTRPVGVISTSDLVRAMRTEVGS